MTWLIATCLRRPGVIIALAILLSIVGINVARHTPYDVFPEFAAPLVEIQTEAPGLSTEEVEALITVPLETAVNGTAWLETIRSKSVLGLSSVVLIFRSGTDLMAARQLVGERVANAARQLPVLAHPPVILPPLSSTSRALKIGVTSDTLSQMELTDLARWTIRPRLMAIPGVANVAIWGERIRQLQVLTDPDRLREHNVTLDAVVRATTDAVAIAAGGFVDTPNQRLPVRHRATIETAEDLAQSVVSFRNGTPLRIGNVAAVETGFPAPIGDAVINDKPGLLLIVEKQPWGNTLEVTQRVEDALAALRPGLSGVDIDSTIFRPATFIEHSLQNLTRAMTVGCVLVAIVLLAFLADWRAAVISITAIPLSLLATGIVLHAFGVTVNTMVLAGLVIAVGEVVDDAIIDVENIARRLRLEREAGKSDPPFHVVLRASIEVRSAVVYASLIVVLVFLPIYFLEGLAGSFFRPLALAYVVAILASLGVALTVTPALALLLLPHAPLRAHDAPLARRLKAGYRALLPGIIARPRWALGIVAVNFAIALSIVPFLGEQFLPDFQERDFLMHWVGKPGTSLDAMRRITMRASQELRAIPGVQSFGAHIGRAEVADEVVGPNFTELWISVAESAPYAETRARIEAVVAGFPGLYRDVLTYLRERIKEVLTGASATIVVRIFGPDLDVLRTTAAAVKTAIADVPGVVDLKVEPQVLIPQVTIRLRPEAAARFGVTAGQLRQASATLIKGQTVGEIFHDQKVVPVTVWSVAGKRTDLEALRALPIDTPSGAQVPFGELADVAIEPAPNEIKREAASRRIDVLCNVAGSDLGGVARAIKARVDTVSFPRAYHPELLGEYAARESSRRQLIAFSLLSLVGIALILHSDFRTPRLTALLLLTLPFALVGGVIAAFLGGAVLSLGSLVGFVTVLGIAARNGIMLVSHYRHLEEEEAEPFGPALVRRGAEERLVPILMTALAAALALVPLIVAGNIPGHEIEYPMAVVIVGGLVTSTALNLFLLPTLYARFAHERQPAPVEP